MARPHRLHTLARLLAGLGARGKRGGLAEVETMIKNDRQHRITKAQAHKLETALVPRPD